jgi:hypothetical protein
MNSDNSTTIGQGYPDPIEQIRAALINVLEARTPGDLLGSTKQLLQCPESSGDEFIRLVIADMSAFVAEDAMWWQSPVERLPLYIDLRLLSFYKNVTSRILAVCRESSYRTIVAEEGAKQGTDVSTTRQAFTQLRLSAELDRVHDDYTPETIDRVVKTCVSSSSEVVGTKPREPGSPVPHR